VPRRGVKAALHITSNLSMHCSTDQFMGPKQFVRIAIARKYFCSLPV
jgi:hypothetical protein